MKSARSIYVLLVDDNRQMRVLVRELLRPLGMRHCAEPGNAAEGVTMMRTFPADLVITDLAMGDEDGLAFARRIRTADGSPNACIPIVMMTGHAERSRVQAAIDAGVNTFLAKPISARSLADHISHALNDRRPFVRTPTFFGPDRRHHRYHDYAGPFRRAEDGDRGYHVNDFGATTLEL